MSEREWGIASYALVGLAFIMTVTYLAWRSGLDAGDIADWVSAIGSIGAIIGAFAVGRRQASSSMMQAMELRRAELIRRRKAIRRVVESAYAQAKALAERLESGEPPRADGVGSYWTSLGRAHFKSAIAALDAIPLFELDIGGLVTEILNIKSSLMRMQEECEILLTDLKSISDDEALRGLEIDQAELQLDPIRMEWMLCDLYFQSFLEIDDDLSSDEHMSLYSAS